MVQGNGAHLLCALLLVEELSGAEFFAADQRSVLHGSLSVADRHFVERRFGLRSRIRKFYRAGSRLPDLPGIRRRKQFPIQYCQAIHREDIGPRF